MRNRRAAVRPVHPADLIAVQSDPFIALTEMMGRPEMRHRLLLGITPTNWNLSAERRNVAVIGAPRGGKSGHLPTMAAAWPGLVVWVSARPEEAIRSMGLLRARMAGGVGDLFDVAPDGSPTPAGLTRRGWTPVSVDWERAQRVSQAVVSSIDTGREGGGFWSTSAALGLAAFLFAAGLHGLPMEWVRRCVKMHEAEEALDVLRGSDAPGAAEAVDELAALGKMSDRTGADVWATMSAVLAAYASRAALDVTNEKPMDLAAAISGRPDVANPYLAAEGQDAPLGCYSTLYLRANPLDQERLAVLICGVLADLWFARNQAINAPPTLLVLDDMASIAIWRELPTVLSLCGGAGLMVVGVFHDEAQCRARWGPAGDSMTTLFGEKVIFRGVEDDTTRNRLSTSTGMRWVTRRNASEGRSGGTLGGLIAGTASGGWQEGFSESDQLVPALTPAEISAGHPAHEQLVLSFHPTRWEWAWSTPYWSPEPSPLWLKAQVASMLFFAHRPELESLDLPEPPDLHRDGGKRLVASQLFLEYFGAAGALGYAIGSDGGPNDDDPPPDDIDPSLVPA
jgi:hypothetical protein